MLESIANLRSDPLAFQWLSKSDTSSTNAVFVDVDYPQLIEQKSQMISMTPELCEIVAPTKISDDGKDVYYSSEKYYAVGCDLSDTRKLESVLATILDLSQALILCTAEVSMTYMPVDAADNLIKWASGIGDGESIFVFQEAANWQENKVQFCLLEQYLPGGEDHPFASKMLSHFESLKTPLRNILHYPQLRDLEQRFHQLGWSQVKARTLWEIYCDKDFVTREDSSRLNQKEAFDEWEELVLFASHYFLLVASTRPISKQDRAGSGDQHVEPLDSALDVLITTATAPDVKIDPKRRFGAIIPYNNGFAHHGGLDSRTRSATVDKYVFYPTESVGANQSGWNELPDPPESLQRQMPRARMCHTITSLSEHCLLVGGRTSPTDILLDCWTFSDGGWMETNPLPFALFRHSAAHVQVVQSGQKQDAVLIYGGKLSATAVSNTWLLWQKHTGWTRLPVVGAKPTARFGACFTSTESGQGVLLGGMDEDGTILQDHYEWSIVADEQGFHVLCHNFRIADPHIGPARFIDRFGAVLNSSRLGLLLIGGVSHEIIPRDYEILKLILQETEDGTRVYKAKAVTVDVALARPLLIGHDVLARYDEVFIVGGGAVCFSFGTFWNTALMRVSPNVREQTIFIKKLTTPPATSSKTTEVPLQLHGHAMQTYAVKRSTVKNADDFAAIVGQGRPLILEGLDLGACVSNWQSLDHVEARVGADREVVVHESSHAQMVFQTKNFSYVRKPFGIFLEEAGNGSMQYLRSLASNNPARKAANFGDDFPRLASDFHLPEALESVKNQAHSSVLRISGPVNMWLHYDVRSALHLFRLRTRLIFLSGDGKCAVSDSEQQDRPPFPALGRVTSLFPGREFHIRY